MSAIILVSCMDNSKKQTLQETQQKPSEKQASSTTISAKGEIKRDHNPKEDALFQLTSAIKHGDINKITTALINGGASKNAPGFGLSTAIENNPYILVLKSEKIPQKVKVQIIEQMHDVGVPHRSQVTVNLNVSNKLAPDIKVQHNAVLYLIYTYNGSQESTNTLLDMIKIFNSDNDQIIYLEAMRNGIISDPVIINALGEQGVAMSKEDMYKLAKVYIHNADIKGLQSLIAIGIDLNYAPEHHETLLNSMLALLSKYEDAQHSLDSERVLSPYNSKESEIKKVQRISMLKLILQNGAELNYGYTGVTTAPIFVTNASILQILLEYGADPNMATNNWPGLDGYSPIHKAIQNGNIAALKLLFEYGANPNASTYEGKSFEEFAKSHLKYSSYPHKDAMIKLIQGYQKSYMFTPKPMTFQQNALNDAVINKDLEKISELCKSTKTGLDIKQQALMLAIRKNDFAAFKAIALASKLDMDAQMTNGTTPLIYAIRLGTHEITNYLLDELNANPNIKDNQGKTAMMHLVHNTSYLSKNLADQNELTNEAPTLLQKLFLKGADMNAKDNEGNTALFHCRSNTSVIQLVDYGCDILAKNNKGQTAGEYYSHNKALFPDIDGMALLDLENANHLHKKNDDAYKEYLKTGFTEVLKKVIEESQNTTEAFSRSRLISQIGLSVELIAKINIEVAKITNTSTSLIEMFKGYKSRESLYNARLEESSISLADITYKISLAEIPLASRVEKSKRQKSLKDINGIVM